MFVNRDLVSGGALVLAGGVYAIYSASVMPLGSVRQMGAGMFPMWLGLMLAVLGACIMIPAFFRYEGVPEFKPRALIAVTAAVLTFAALIRFGGLIPAIVGTTVLSSLALPGRRVLLTVFLCVALTVTCWLIFVVLLKLPVPIIRWSF